MLQLAREENRGRYRLRLACSRKCGTCFVSRDPSKSQICVPGVVNVPSRCQRLLGYLGISVKKSRRKRSGFRWALGGGFTPVPDRDQCLCGDISWGGGQHGNSGFAWDGCCCDSSGLWKRAKWWSQLSGGSPRVHESCAAVAAR